MERRDFIWNLGMGLAAVWTTGRLSWPMALEAADRPLFLALLADAHLHNGDPNHAEAQALARAVAEIKALKPAPHLVFFAGDLAHHGNPMALGLGAEILSDLPMPLLAVRGERDGCAGQGGPGRQIFHNGPFVYNYEGINLLGLDTQWQTTPDGPGFALGGDQHRWLAQLWPRLDPAAPLMVLSHAPLIPIHRAWGQWTMDSGPLLTRLSRFENVTCLHGHVHRSDPLEENNFTISLPDDWFSRKPKTENRKPSHFALPATSWPLPSPLTGTPRKLRPGIGPRGCGWALLQGDGSQQPFRRVLWEA